MLIYEKKLSKNTFTLLEQLFPAVVQQHILEVIEASPTSQIYCKIENKVPNVSVYLVEHNHMELYTMCHFFYIRSDRRRLPVPKYALGKCTSL